MHMSTANTFEIARITGRTYAQGNVCSGLHCHVQRIQQSAVLHVVDDFLVVHGRKRMLELRDGLRPALKRIVHSFLQDCVYLALALVVVRLSSLQLRDGSGKLTRIHYVSLSRAKSGARRNANRSPLSHERRKDAVRNVRTRCLHDAIANRR